MQRLVKLFLISVFILFSIENQVYSNKLSKAEFFSSSKYLSPNNDGFQDIVILYLYINQDNVIKIKRWDISIFNSSSILVQRFTSGNEILKNKYLIPWDGKDTNGNLVNDGVYTCVLTLNYTYGTLEKQFSLEIIVNTANSQFNLEMDFAYPIIYTNFNSKNPKVYNPLNNAIIQKKINIFQKELFSNFSSYILDVHHSIIESRIWNEITKSRATWNGYIQDKPADFSIYHYLFVYKSKENQLIEHIQPGIFIVPFKISSEIKMNHVVMNKFGFSFHNQIFQPLKLEISISQQEKNYQLYCFDNSLLGDKKWKLQHQSAMRINSNTLLNFIKNAPENQYCFIVFFESPIPNELNDIFKVHEQKILTVFPFYIDTHSPKLSAKLEYEELQMDLNYNKNLQKIRIQTEDNTFINKIQAKIYLDIQEKKILLQEYHLKTKKTKESNVYEILWSGNSIQNIPLESEDRFSLEIEAIDIAGNIQKLSKNFKNDVFFRRNNYGDFYTNIPLIYILDKNLNITDTGEKILNKIYKNFKYFNKKYIYLRVHSFTETSDDDNLQKSEMISEKIYKYLHKDFNENVLFYRGVGKLFPRKNTDSELTNYLNNRLEIIFTDDLPEKLF